MLRRVTNHCLSGPLSSMRTSSGMGEPIRDTLSMHSSHSYITLSTQQLISLLIFILSSLYLTALPSHDMFSLQFYLLQSLINIVHLGCNTAASSLNLQCRYHHGLPTTPSTNTPPTHPFKKQASLPAADCDGFLKCDSSVNLLDFRIMSVQ